LRTDKKWKGLKAQWLGTKQVWKVLNRINVFGSDILEKIQNKKAIEWDNNFCNEVYDEVIKNKLYITNLSKATQLDARPLSDFVFEKYLNLLKEEIKAIKPKVIISFGNQVSSIILGETINVSKCRKKAYNIKYR